MIAIEFIQDYYIEIILSILASIVVSIGFHFFLLARDQKHSLGDAESEYTVFVPVGGRVAFFSISVFGLAMTVLFFRRPSTETIILGSVSAFIFVFMLIRTILNCAWRVEVQGNTLTLYRFFRKPLKFSFEDVSLVSRNSRGYSLYSGTKELFNFILGKIKTDPGTYLLKRDLEEKGQWIHH